MLISWELLKDFVDVPHTVDEVAERLTFSGSEVEGITYCAGKMQGVIAARIAVLEKHPTEAKYYVAKLETGSGLKVCVTSAHNMKQGDYVLYAGEGSVLPDGTVMGTRDFAGVLSYGMMLSAEELGLHDVDDPSGLLILPDEVTPGKDALTLYHIGDVILDVSITPNRGDTLSHLGMAREIAGLFHDAVLKTPDYMLPLTQDKDWSESFGTISLPDEGCLRYRLGLATGAVIGQSPLTARVDLAHLGMRPINNAVDVTNYVMLMLGQPLHAFDLNTLPAREITVRSAREGEHMMTLDGQDRALTERDMLITSGGEAIALAGVMGGEQTGINDSTSTIVIESASFSAQRVSHTSRRLGINSEAAFRFSRTVDPELSATALTAASALMREWCGAKVDYRPLSAENGTCTPKPITLTRKKLSTYLSWEDMTEAANILEGFGIKQVSEGEFLPPSWRPDITIEEDLIEEIGRYRGYNDADDKLPGEMPRRADIGEAMSLAGFIRSTMMARGFTEIVTYSFLPEDFPKKLCLPDDDVRAHPLTIANPISREQMAMRTTLLPGLLMGLRTSITSGWREPVRMFEQGKVFVDGKEAEHLAAILFNGTDTRSVNNDRAEDFYNLKADVETLIRIRGYEPKFTADTEPFLHGGMTAEITIDGQKVGWIGRMKPAIEQMLGVNGVYAFETDTSVLMSGGEWRFSAVSQYPASYRDVSLVVRMDRSNDDVVRDVRAVALGVDSVRLFDEWRGEGMVAGFRSLAYTKKPPRGETGALTIR